MKQIAILEYSIMFDPSESWSNGSQFEAQFADFFGAYGFEAQIVEARGNSGKRVIFLERVAKPEPPKPVPQGPAIKEQIKQVQQATPPKDFKRFEESGVPKSLVNQDKRPPRVQFIQGRTNRQKLRGNF